MKAREGVCVACYAFIRLHAHKQQGILEMAIECAVRAAVYVYKRIRKDLCGCIFFIISKHPRTQFKIAKEKVSFLRSACLRIYSSSIRSKKHVNIWNHAIRRKQKRKGLKWFFILYSWDALHIDLRFCMQSIESFFCELFTRVYWLHQNKCYVWMCILFCARVFFSSVENMQMYFSQKALIVKLKNFIWFL